jgi:hypothetical protein
VDELAHAKRHPPPVPAAVETNRESAKLHPAGVELVHVDIPLAEEDDPRSPGAIARSAVALTTLAQGPAARRMR